MPFWIEISRHRIRFVKTLALYSCYLSLGFSLGIVGPTLLDLRQQVQSGIQQISFALTARAGGYALGSLTSACMSVSSDSSCEACSLTDLLLCLTRLRLVTVGLVGHIVGLVYPKLNFQAATVFCMASSALLTFSVPFLNTIAILLTIFAVNGFCLGLFEAGTYYRLSHSCVRAAANRVSGSNIFLLQLWGKGQVTLVVNSNRMN